MTTSKKEAILSALETILNGIQAGAKPATTSTHTYVNSVSYVDRQYMVFEEIDVQNHPKPWIIINNLGESFKPFPGKTFENTILVEIVGFVELTGDEENLDSLMNSLQLDILIAILTDVSLSGLCSYIMPQGIITVDEMVSPYGGFVLKLEIVYNTMGTNY